MDSKSGYPRTGGVPFDSPLNQSEEDTPKTYQHVHGAGSEHGKVRGRPKVLIQRLLIYMCTYIYIYVCMYGHPPLKPIALYVACK